MKRSKLFSVMLALFLASNLAVLTAYAAKPVPLPPTSVDTYVNFFDGNYDPGTPMPLGDSGLVKLIGRFTEFTMDLPNFGPAIFTSLEDAVINDMGYGTAHGEITVELVTGMVLVAKSTGKLYPVIIDGRPGIGFAGRIASIGQGNKAIHVTGSYSGHFLPEDVMMPLMGDLHMDVLLKLN